MDETNLRDGFPGLVAGRLEGLAVPDLMWLLCRRRATGVLHLQRGDVTKKVFFLEGHIVFAASSDPDDRLGELLLRDGLVELEQLEDAIEKLYLGKRLGTLLVEMGHLRPEDLVRGVIEQVREIVLGLFTWEEGAYRFDEGPLPAQEVVTLGMRTGEILLQGIRRVRSFTRIRRSIGGPRQRFALSAGSAEIVEGLALTDGERLLLQQLQHGSASIATLCDEIFVSNFEIHQALWALKVLGAVEDADGAADSASGGASLEGRLGRGGIVEALVRLCRSGETGVLHVTRGTAERTFHLREGRCIFATSNSIDDGLVSHLLRRGVISIRDREETAKRLLSNKRVGTILLEMGVLDERDLREMVREQLSEIVCDTFRWEGGEYAFVPGELPTLEDIVLEMSLEDLVAEGIRRVTSWNCVREGCGGSPRTRLSLTSEYLDVLDRMKVGADEWEVVSCLGEPKSVIEICSRVSLGDFRVCQILWSLRLLGAIAEVAAEDVTDAPVDEAPESLPVDETLAAVPVAEASGETEILGAFEGIPPTEAPPEGDTSHAVSVAAVDEAAEVVSEPWRLTEEAFPAPPRPEASAAEEESSAETSDASDDSVPALDSPADATLVLTREEVEAALGLSRPTCEAADFELAEPGSGADMVFEKMLDADVAGGREFEIGEPTPEVSDFEGAPFSGTEPALEMAPPGTDEHVRPEEIVAAASSNESADPCDSEAADIPSAEAEAVVEEPVEVRAADAVPAEAEAAVEEPVEVRGTDVASAEPEAAVENPIVDLEGAIVRFNQLHRVLYRAIRAEVGAGAANFIQACRGGLGEGLGELFETSRLLPDGTWEAEGLKKGIRQRSVREPWSRLERLLDREFEMLRPQIGEARVKALHDQMSELRRSS
jgi:hypothetical protein